MSSIDKVSGTDAEMYYMRTSVNQGEVPADSSIYITAERLEAQGNEGYQDHNGEVQNSNAPGTANSQEEKVLTDEQKLADINKRLAGTDVSLNGRDNSFIKEVLKKYDNMIEYYKNNGGVENNQTKIQQRLVNYIKGLEFRQLEDSWADAVLDGNLDSVQSKDMPTTKAAYLALAEQYIETGNIECDESGDEGLSYTEFRQMELESEGMTTITDKQEQVIRKAFDKIDDNDNQLIEKAEMAAHFAVMSIINDRKSKSESTFNNITGTEWATATLLTQFDKDTVLNKVSDDGSTKLKQWLDENKTGRPNEADLIKKDINAQDRMYILSFFASDTYDTLISSYVANFRG